MHSKQWLIVWIVSAALTACGGRSASLGDWSVSQDQALTGDMAVADASVVEDAPLKKDQGALDAPPAFCSGAPSVTLNEQELVLKEVEPKMFMGACCKEGANLQIKATLPDDEEVLLNVTLNVKLPHTITDKPLPNTIDYAAPPQGFDTTIHISSPPLCIDPECGISDMLWLEVSHAFEGFAILAGNDYQGELMLTLCLSASRDKDPNTQVHSVQMYLPDVRIPRWQIMP